MSTISRRQRRNADASKSTDARAPGKLRRFAAASLVAPTVLLAACNDPPEVPSIACTPGQPAAALPDIVTMYQDDGMWDGGAAPKLLIHAPYNGVQSGWGEVHARSWSENSNRSTAKNPCDSLYGSAEEKFKWVSSRETIFLYGPNGTGFTLEEEWLTSFFAGQGSNEYVLNGPGGENIAISKKTEASGGAVAIKLADPATGKTLATINKVIDGFKEHWEVESMDQSRVPTWILLQLVALKSADDGREAAEEAAAAAAAAAAASRQ